MTADEFLKNKGINKCTAYTDNGTYYINDLAWLLEEYYKLKSKPIINHISTCNFYQPDNTTAMNCLHCGRGKYLHRPNPLYP
jgi:CMP-N-acetylneuraminic acid synthetase